MKMQTIFLTLALLVLPVLATTTAQTPQTQVIIDLTRPSPDRPREITVPGGQRISIKITAPGGQNLRLVHKIPSGLADIKTGTAPGNCSLIKRLDTPALIFCATLDEATEIVYSAQLPAAKSTVSSGFTAAKGITATGQPRWFFQRDRITILPASPTPSAGASAKPSPQPSLSPVPTARPDDPASIPRHNRSLSDPQAQIITNQTKGAIIASAFFEPQNEPMIIRELTVELTPVDTAALYGDTPDDLDVISRVSLLYQDGTPVTRVDGKPAVSAAISTAGKVRFTGLDFAIPESGERLFVAVDTDTLLNGQSGSAFAAAFSFDAGDADIRGFWSGAQLEGDIAPDRQESPAQYVLANKMTATLAMGQNKVLLSGRNQLLGFDINVSGGDEAYLQAVTAQITKSASGDGFRVTRLRLRQGSDILASKTGVDLTGGQTLTVGVCAAGDLCSASNSDSQSIFRQTTMTLEAEITPQNGSLTGANALSASIEINGSTPGQDDILWQDYGSGDDDGVSIRWINLGESSLTRLENTLRNP